MATLPEPHYVDRDPRVILRECIEQYEAAAERSLSPADVERLVIDLIAYRETLVRIAIQDAAKQNLLPYARYPMIDLLAQIVGTGRLPAQPASAPMRATVTPSPTLRTVPAGTRIRSKDRKAIFAVLADITIGVDASFGDGVVVCETAGLVGNGYAEGQISELVGTLSFAATFANTAESSGGTASEDTERLRARIPQALDERAAAGPKEAYESIARSAHQDVLDVVAQSPSPGNVRLAVLVREGGSVPTVLAAVEAAASADDVRPFTDTVFVQEAASVAYTIEAELTLKAGLTSEEETATLAAAQAAAEAFAAERASGLGRSVIVSRVYVVLSVDNVEGVSLTSGGVVVAEDEWAECTLIDLGVAP